MDDRWTAYLFLASHQPLTLSSSPASRQIASRHRHGPRRAHGEAKAGAVVWHGVASGTTIRTGHKTRYPNPEPEKPEPEPEPDKPESEKPEI
jgi:hypothetical protein